MIKCLKNLVGKYVEITIYDRDSHFVEQGKIVHFDATYATAFVVLDTGKVINLRYVVEISVKNNM